LLNVWVCEFDVDHSDPGRRTHDCSFTEDHHDETDHFGSTESARVSKDEPEGVPSTGAEILAVESNLDVGVLRDKFDVLIKAPENTSHAARDGLINHVILVSHGFIFLVEVFENYSDESNQSDNEGAESN
jgi:hypothetical protein